jgi:hypothetical protein
MRRRKKLSRDFTAYDSNFDINVGRTALERNVDISSEGLQ